MSPGTVAASGPAAAEAPPTLTAVQAPSRYVGGSEEAIAWSRSVTGSAAWLGNTTPTAAMSVRWTSGIGLVGGARAKPELCGLAACDDFGRDASGVRATGRKQNQIDGSGKSYDFVLCLVLCFLRNE